MKVLIIALEGQIRQALEEQFTLRKRPFQTVGEEWFCADGPVDVQRPPLKIPEDVGVVVNALSLEWLLSGAEKSLVEPLSLLAQACEQAAIPHIKLSSCQVFDGSDGSRFRETEEVLPGSREGALLARMEELLRGSSNRHIILRTGALYSSVGDNLLTNILSRFERGEELSLSNKGKRGPVHCSDLARVVSAIIDQLSCGCEGWGTYHYCSSDPATSYQFAEVVLSVATQYSAVTESPSLVEADEGSTTDWPQPLLNCEKLLNTFGIKQLPWRAYIVPTVKEVYQPEPTVEEAQHGEQH